MAGADIQFIVVLKEQRPFRSVKFGGFLVWFKNMFVIVIAFFVRLHDIIKIRIWDVLKDLMLRILICSQ